MEKMEHLAKEDIISFKCGNYEFALTKQELKKIPYLDSYHSFSSSSFEKKDSSASVLTLDPKFNPKLMEVVVKYIRNDRLRSLFTNLPDEADPTELFLLLDYFMVKKPESSIANWNTRLKNKKKKLRKIAKPKAERSLARDTAVELSWTGCEVVGNSEEKQTKLFHLVLYIMSHARLFYYKIRKNTLKCFLANFHSTKNQRDVLNGWLISYPEDPACLATTCSVSEISSDTEEERLVEHVPAADNLDTSAPDDLDTSAPDDYWGIPAPYDWGIPAAYDWRA